MILKEIFKLQFSISRKLSNNMRAVVVKKFGGPAVLKVEKDWPLPKISETQVLVKVGAAGINPVDTYIRAGQYSVLPPLPYTPGKDCAGTVEQVGSRVTEFKKGDRVFATTLWSPQAEGTCAEFCPVDQNYCWSLPEAISYAEGAGVPVPYFTAYRALFQKAKAKPGQSVLIHGASGGVGLAATQLASSHGLRVFGTAGTEEGLSLVKKSGAERVFNHRTKGYADEIVAATGGSGVNCILEMLSDVNLPTDLELLARGGVVVIVGCRGECTINPRLMMGPETSVVGVAVGTADKADQHEISASIFAGLRAGYLKPIVDREYKLEEVDKVHHDIIHSKGAKGNLVVIP